MHLGRQKEKVVKTDAVVMFFLLFKGVGVGVVFLSVDYTSWRTPSPVSLPPSPLEQWKKPGCLGHIGDYTQLGGDYNKPWHYKDPYIEQPICHGNSDRFFFVFSRGSSVAGDQRRGATQPRLHSKWSGSLDTNFPCLGPWVFFYGERGIGWLGKIW